MASRMTVQTKKKRALDKYAGEWVAFVDGNIVAHSKILRDLMEAVEAKGIKEKASVFRVPRKDEGPYILTVL